MRLFDGRLYSSPRINSEHIGTILHPTVVLYCLAPFFFSWWVLSTLPALLTHLLPAFVLPDGSGLWLPGRACMGGSVKGKLEQRACVNFLSSTENRYRPPSSRISSLFLAAQRAPRSSEVQDSSPHVLSCLLCKLLASMLHDCDFSPAIQCYRCCLLSSVLGSHCPAVGPTGRASHGWSLLLLQS